MISQQIVMALRRKYEAEIDCDKTIIKGILQKIYSEACEVE